MDTKRRVCVYGKSVILDTLELSIRKSPRFDVFSIAVTTKEGLIDLKADVIFFDLNGRFPSEAFALLENHDGLQIIGVSPDSNVVKRWSGQRLCQLSTSELIKTIDMNPAFIENIIHTAEINKQ